jgi:ABC-type transport system involved in multi-copper enzyme maturation permease subunit
MRAAARRWQTYALRSGFVAALLVAFLFVWLIDAKGVSELRVRDMARIGERFYTYLIGTQLILLLLAAPAATAGAVAEDRARGGLLHLLVTDLSNTEIVLGKLFGRLIPVLGLVVCSLPVPGLVALLGGIEPDSLIGAYLVMAGTAILGCTIALVLSIHASRPSEALLGTYFALAVLVLPYPVWMAIDGFLRTSTIPSWLVKTNPFWLAFSPYTARQAGGLADMVRFFVASVIIASGLVAFAVFRVRAITVARASQPQRREKAIATPWFPGPSLDANPVLWREWHRQNPSRRTRVIWWIYGIVAGVFSSMAMADVRASSFSFWVNGLQVSIGMLLFSVGAVTSLAEERARGSLDLLLATPLATSEILWGKWWGAFRAVPLLLVLPAFVIWPRVVANNSYLSAFLTLGLILAYGAASTSLAIACATWIPRIGRATLYTAGTTAVLSAGSVLVIVGAIPRSPVTYFLAMASPLFGPGFTASAPRGLLGFSFYSIRMSRYEGLVGTGATTWIVFYSVTSGLLMFAALRTFDRCLGRASQRRPPQRAA